MSKDWKLSTYPSPEPRYIGHLPDEFVHLFAPFVRILAGRSVAKWAGERSLGEKVDKLSCHLDAFICCHDETAIFNGSQHLTHHVHDDNGHVSAYTLRKQLLERWYFSKPERVVWECEGGTRCHVKFKTRPPSQPAGACKTVNLW